MRTERAAPEMRPSFSLGGGGIAVALVLAWSYWPTLADLWAFWSDNLDYASGQFVPLVVIYVIWSRRGELAKLSWSTCWFGLGLLVFAQLVRFYGIYDMYGSLERYSMVLSVLGILWFLFGTGFLWKFRWAMLFLFLTVPLPGRIHSAVSLPLQDFATRSAVVGLELLGFLVVREGNVLRVSEASVVAVAEACSGLRMLNAFALVCVTLSFVAHRPVWQKVGVVLSCIPIAVFSNTVRLVVTVLLFEHAHGELAQRLSHDWAGIAMMPFAVAVAIGELKLFGWLSGARRVAADARNARKANRSGVRKLVAVQRL
ncbi:MAG: exosortase/archaeosortase family protein [Phycisphaerae bacterium]|nr:exosortase/archaeosortase family protein [Phycisphaerae bacterium]